MKPKHYILLDRDGTIIKEKNYLSAPEDVELLNRASEGLRLLQSMGLGLVVVSNQSGVGRGFFDEQRLSEIHHRLQELLEKSGVNLHKIYYCPHIPDDNCHCRKPNPGLIEIAAQELGFNPLDSFVIGDKPCDIELGQRVGATTLLVRTGYGAEFAKSNQINPDYIVDDLWEAAQVICQKLGY